MIIWMIYKERQIKQISQQVNAILFQQKDVYIPYYKEGTLSFLESEIVKLVNRLSEQNRLLLEDKIVLKQSLEDISHQMKTPLTSLNLEKTIKRTTTLIRENRVACYNIIKNSTNRFKYSYISERKYISKRII